MPALERIFETAKEKILRVVMPEMDDPRISGAADKLEKERLARVLDLSEPTQEMIDILVSGRGRKEANRGSRCNGGRRRQSNQTGVRGSKPCHRLG